MSSWCCSCPLHYLSRKFQQFRILGHSNGRLAITVDGEFGNVISKFSQQLFQPHGLTFCKVGWYIFSIRGDGHCRLSLAAPAHCSSINEKGITSCWLSPVFISSIVGITVGLQHALEIRIGRTINQADVSNAFILYTEISGWSPTPPITSDSSILFKTLWLLLFLQKWLLVNSRLHSNYSLLLVFCFCKVFTLLSMAF